MEDVNELLNKLKELKEGYIPVPKKLALELGFSAAGMLMDLYSQYIYYLKKGELNEKGEFFYTVADVQKNTGLSKDNQSTIIRKLKELHFIEYTMHRDMPKKRYFKMNGKVDEMIINAITGTDAKDKIINIKQKANKEVQRCLDLTNPVGGNPSIQLAENPPTSKRESLHIVGGKTSVNKNREKEQNIKTEQKQIVCLSAPETKYCNKLIDEISDKLNIPKGDIKEKIDKANKKEDKNYTYEDLYTGYEYKVKGKTIDHIIDNPEIEGISHKLNSIISSTIKGVPDALQQQEKEEAQYEENNNRIFNEIPEKFITTDEENTSIAPEDKKQLDNLKMMNSNNYIELFKGNEKAQYIYKRILKPFENNNVFISGFTRTDMANFKKAYEAIQELAG